MFIPFLVVRPVTDLCQSYTIDHTTSPREHAQIPPARLTIYSGMRTKIINLWNNSISTMRDSVPTSSYSIKRIQTPHPSHASPTVCSMVSDAIDNDKHDIQRVVNFDHYTNSIWENIDAKYSDISLNYGMLDILSSMGP